MPSVPLHNQPSFSTTLRMKAQKIRDTKCEMSVRRVLHSMGLRYRVHIYPLESLKRRADIVFRRSRTAVFIDGCFWHGCTEHRGPSKTNTDWWSRKIQTNKVRDQDTDMKLRSAGWSVLRYWEHEQPVDVALQIRSVLHSGSEKTQ